jgi:hypothetical protein
MTNFTKFTRPLTIVAVVAGFTQNALAQGNAAELMKAGKADANKLANAYFSPALTAFGLGLNGGWFNTAKVHGIGGFDITICGNVPFAPSAQQSYNVNDLGLTNVSLVDPNSDGVAPTIFGAAKSGPDVYLHTANPAYGQPGQPKEIGVDTFALPQGIGANFAPVPTAQLTVGVGYGTEVGVRFMPKLNLGGFGMGLWGFAVKHDFKQWIPGIKEMPFDLSAMFGFTKLNTGYKLSNDDKLTPETGSDIYDPNPNRSYNDQSFEFISTSWTTNVIISKKLGPFTPYLGLGYQASKTNLNILGDFPITSVNEQYDPTAPAGSNESKTKKIEVLSDPISIASTSSNTNGFRATAGFRLKLAVLTIHGDYTFSKYNMATVGIGLNLQSIVPFSM